MADVFTKIKRSEVMSLIRSRGNNATELTLAKLLRANRITGWRRHQAVFGKPDFIFRKARLAVFADGCFWHGCPKTKHAPRPKNRAEWWATKLKANKRRDRLVSRTLRAEGWSVVRIWECDLAKPSNWSRIASRIRRAMVIGEK
jgi:DNA mismatch endonuclease (patch repair protein)